MVQLIQISETVQKLQWTKEALEIWNDESNPDFKHFPDFPEFLVGYLQACKKHQHHINHLLKGAEYTLRAKGEFS